MTTEVSWVTAFLDLPADGYDRGVDFWQAVTGYRLSPSRGDHDEFATLVPPEGDAHLRVQRTSDGPPGVHLDLHQAGQELRVLASPAGLPYCEVSEPLTHRTPPATWPGGHRSIVDQVCVDIPADRFDEECGFWAARLGRELRASSVSTDFRALPQPPGQAVRVLLQRIGDERPRATAHLDVATDDRTAETRRHQALGASVVDRRERWTVLADPLGSAYCITDRDPDTGGPLTAPGPAR